MNSDLIALYRRRLVARELRLLSSYRLNGRRPRITSLAYWRASFIPLLVPLIFFALKGVGVSDAAAALPALVFLGALLIADVQLFVLNAGAWIFAQKGLSWSKVEQAIYHELGQDLDLHQQGKSTSWDKVQVPPAFLTNAAKSYQQFQRTPPKLADLIQQSSEARTILISFALLIAIGLLSPQFMDLALPIFLFVIAWPAKRLKASLDFCVTWPALKGLFDWDKINHMAQGQRLR